MIRKTALLIFLAAFPLAGCASKPQTYDISITNRLDTPVTIWLTKQDGPYEDGWVPPEELAVGNTEDKHLGGVVIKPGETAATIATAHSDLNNPAILRIYQAVSVNSILGLDRGNKKRDDIVLQPGKTELDVIVSDGQLDTEEHKPTPATAPSPR